MSRSEERAAERFDAVVVGGGPAGLSAAYWLARYRRRVRVYDAGGGGRNRAALVLHGYPGLEDASPEELRRRIRVQAAGAGAELCDGRVVDVQGERDAFRVATEDGDVVHARRVVLAYGLRDIRPEIPGLEDAYGVTVHHCPDCDGPSVADEPVGVIGWSRAAAELALFLLTWASRVVLLRHGHDEELTAGDREALLRHGIATRDSPITRIDQVDGRIRAVYLADGECLALRRLFVHIASPPASDLAVRLGCATAPDGRVVVDAGQETTVPGVYAAGDIAGHPHLAISAVAEGVCAALALHRSLLPSDLELTEEGAVGGGPGGDAGGDAGAGPSGRLGGDRDTD